MITIIFLRSKSSSNHHQIINKFNNLLTQVMEMNFREALDGAHTVSCSEEQVPNIQTFQPSQKCLETGETTKFLEYGSVTFFGKIIINYHHHHCHHCHGYPAYSHQSYSHQVGICHNDEGWEYDTVTFPLSLLPRLGIMGLPSTTTSTQCRPQVAEKSSHLLLYHHNHYKSIKYIIILGITIIIIIVEIL